MKQEREITYTCVACGATVTRPRMSGRFPTLCPPCGLHGVRDRSKFHADRQMPHSHPPPETLGGQDDEAHRLAIRMLNGHMPR